MEPQRNISTDDARRALRADYYTDVRSIAREAIAEIAAGRIDGRDGLDEWIHETCDGASNVIYTGQAIETLLASDNWSAIDETGLDPTTDDQGLSGILTRAAYFAMAADVREQIEAELTYRDTIGSKIPRGEGNAEDFGLPEDFDLDDDATWPANRTAEGDSDA